MSYDVIKKTACVSMLLFFFSVSLISQNISDKNDIYEFNAECLDVGSLYKYEIDRGAKKSPLDYWLYISQDKIVETFFDSTSIDKTGILKTDYQIDTGSFFFTRSTTTNMLPANEKQWKTKACLFDAKNESLRIALLFDLPPPHDRIAYREDIPFNPTVWQRDLGIYFSVFFRYLKQPATSFSICYDAYEHLIFMKVASVGEDEVNGIPCIKYKVDGEGLWSRLIGQGGYVWVARDDPRHYMVQHTMTIGWSWVMKDFSITLKEITTSTVEEWKALQLVLITNAEINK